MKLLSYSDGLFTSSRDRKYVGFQLVEKLLPSLLADEVGVVFSPNLLHCLMNNSHSAGNSLYPAVNHLVSGSKWSVTQKYFGLSPKIFMMLFSL